MFDFFGAFQGRASEFSGPSLTKICHYPDKTMQAVTGNLFHGEASVKIHLQVGEFWLISKSHVKKPANCQKIFMNTVFFKKLTKIVL